MGKEEARRGARRRTVGVEVFEHEEALEDGDEVLLHAEVELGDEQEAEELALDVEAVLRGHVGKLLAEEVAQVDGNGNFLIWDVDKEKSEGFAGGARAYFRRCLAI